MQNFSTDLKFSNRPKFIQQEFSILQRLYPNALKIEKSNIELDKRGADYSILLSDREIYVDFKRRRQGCSKYWKRGVEIVIEIWSNFEKRIKGWLFKDNSLTDQIIFIFDEIDCATAFIVNFRELQTLVKEKFFYWKKLFPVSKQKNQGYKSESFFLPVAELKKYLQVQTIPSTQ